MTREHRLTQVFIKLADTLVDDFEPAGYLRMFAEATVELLEIDAIGLTLTDNGRVLRVLAIPGSPAVLMDETDADASGYATSETLPLRLRGEVIGSMDLFRAGATDFSEQDLTLGQALAEMATIGLLHERGARSRDEVCGQLQHALDSRILIEQAKGMLAERAGLSVADAFAAMRSYARGRGCELKAVANGVLDGTLRTTAFLTS